MLDVYRRAGRVNDGLGSAGERVEEIEGVLEHGFLFVQSGLGGR